MLALLLGSGVVYLALGDLTEALILLAFAMTSVLVSAVQQTRTEHVLEALRDLTSPRALVIRDGRQVRIAGPDVVRGDIVVITDGDRVPADARLLRATDLLVDESALTGESVPVRKSTAIAAEGRDLRPGGDDLPYVFSGTLVVRGSGLGEILRTGPRSEMGKIGQSLQTVQVEPPRLRVQTSRLVLIFGAVGGTVSVLAVLLYGLFRGGWLEAILAGIALGMSMLPEELPVVLTVFMAMGAWRISRARVLTRQPPAIETLGSATVLCTDKTGTLTENRMAVQELQLADGRRAQLDGVATEFHRLLRYAVLASAQETSDPMELAIRTAAEQHLAQAALPRGAPKEVFGIRPDLLAMSQLWDLDSGDLTVASKGAPEAIATLCRLDEEARARLLASVEEMAAGGLRVLAIASGEAAEPAVPNSQADLRLRLEGIVGLADPLRPGVVEAVTECRTAGIRVVMVTGDYPATAAAIARQAGLDWDQVMSGDELDRLDDGELARRARSVNVFARIMPQQKLRIVEALKRDGEVVAMTGDGVNDAPSLKAANIAIAMGGRGTDVAREASSLVLLDDDFGSIVRAVRLGRRIYDNLRKAIGFIFAVHVPIAALALIPLLFGSPIILGPVHIAFLEMVIDPVCSLVFEAEAEEGDVMRRSPRPPEQSLFPLRWTVWSLLQGAVAFLVVGGVYLGAIRRGMPPTEVRAITYFALVVCIVALIFVNRSFSASIASVFRGRNRALAVVLISVLLVLALSLLWPFAEDLFQFGPLHPDDLAITAAAGIVLLAALQFSKRFQPGLIQPAAAREK
jgi:P-type Ca2+ transporter type 2C